METVKASYITAAHRDTGEIRRDETNRAESYVFDSSQFFPARDGSWLMVDWVDFDTTQSWYVVECDN